MDSHAQTGSGALATTVLVVTFVGFFPGAVAAGVEVCAFHSWLTSMTVSERVGHAREATKKRERIQRVHTG